MTRARRLSSTIEVIRLTCSLFGDHPALADRVATADGELAFATTTFAELWRRVVALASGWMDRGLVAPGDAVTVCGEPSVAWMVADLACLYSGAVSVPLPASLPDDDLAHILSETSPTVLVCTPATAPLMRSLAASCPSVRALVVMDGAFGAPDDAPPVYLMRDLESTPCPPRPPTENAPDSLVTILYTSGGTGRPKGVPFSDLRWRGTLTYTFEAGPVTVNYLPLCHVMGRVGVVYYTLLLGGTTYFVPTRELSLLLPAMRLVRPTFLALIPTVSNFFYQHCRELVTARTPPGADAATAAACEAAVLADARTTLFGDRLRSIRCGSAPTAPEVLRFLERFAPVSNYYSSTELGPVSNNDRVLDQIEYQLVDVPELGYTTRDRPYPRGELLVRSPRATREYFKRPDATALYSDAGGFVRTGDIFEERGPRHIVWIDRKSSVVRLAHGKFVELTRLEHLFAASCPSIRQIFVHGSAHRDHLLAVIVPRATADPAVDAAARKRQLRAELDRAARAAGLLPHEVPRDFLVEEEPFSVDNHLLTDAGKPRRPALKARYEAQLDALYAEMAARRSQAVGDAATATLSEQVVAAAASTLGLPRGELDGSATFVGLGGDSLGAVSLCARLEALVGAAPPVAAVLDGQLTLAELAARLERQLNGADDSARFASIHVHGEREVAADELRLDRFLGAALDETRAPAVDRPRTILLTGANGFLGRFLLLELLARVAEQDGRVIALVRAPDDAAARARLVAGIAVSGDAAVERFEALSRDRLDVRAAELMRPRLGLTSADYERLAAEVDAILHNGALVNHALPYRQLFAPNVAGTAEVLRFALHRRLKPVGFISSIAVAAGLSRAQPIGEHEDAAALWPRRPTGSADDVVGFGYATSKWASELLVRDFSARSGAGVTIFRCGSLLAHPSWRGQINPADALTRLIASLVATGLAPASFYAPEAAGPRGLDGVPVDRAAAIIAALTLERCDRPRLYHVVRRPGAHDLDLDGVVDILARAGRIRERVARYEDWFAALQSRLLALDEPARRRSALPILSRWRQPLRGELALDTRDLGNALARLTGDANFPSLGEADVLAWLRALDDLG